MKALSIHLDMRETASEPDVEAACAWPFAARSRTDKEAPPSGFFFFLFFPSKHIYILSFFSGPRGSTRQAGAPADAGERAREPRRLLAMESSAGWHGLARAGRGGEVTLPWLLDCCPLEGRGPNGA